jgi:hypothetical protein
VLQTDGNTVTAADGGQGEQDLSQSVDRILSKPPRVAELRAALAELTGDVTKSSVASR